MPKTSVNENGQAFTSENEVGPAGEWLMPPPPGDPIGAQDRRQLELSVLVPTRTDRGHHQRAL
jgi:hypothetical protein